MAIDCTLLDDESGQKIAPLQIAEKDDGFIPCLEKLVAHYRLGSTSWPIKLWRCGKSEDPIASKIISIFVSERADEAPITL
jgi:hypothetical protein